MLDLLSSSFLPSCSTLRCTCESIRELGWALEIDTYVCMRCANLFAWTKELLKKHLHIYELRLDCLFTAPFESYVSGSGAVPAPIYVASSFLASLHPSFFLSFCLLLYFFLSPLNLRTSEGSLLSPTSSTDIFGSGYHKERERKKSILLTFSLLNM